ncbi:MAG TPA: thiamine-phosphate kinase [Gemmatimonadaceae bacterium]|nr:thiamine-phosphate kinase [Gemmatimonadaceae bacterium]
MTLRDTALGPGPEFDAIREMVRRWGPRARGIGDDAALLDVPAGQHVAVSTDASVEDVHFRRHWMRPREIGYRATIAALSDLAAVAASPLGLVCALAVPDAWRDDLLELADGIGEAAHAHGALIVGGNVTRGDKLSITITVLGTVTKALPRDGVRAGDTIFVTGRVGGSGAALAALLRGDVPDDAARERFLRPVPRIAEARWLAEHGAHAAIDVSDGLLAELGHLSAASSVAIRVDPARVPCFGGVAPEDALRSGEEYELVVAARTLDTRVFEQEHGVPLTAIGSAAALGGRDAPCVEVEGGDRGSRVARGAGHDHFSR